LLLATGNGSVGSSSLKIADGANLHATGTLADTTTTDYIVPSYLTPPTGFVGDTSGAGAVVRIANGAERLISRTGDAAPANTKATATLAIGAATLSGTSLALDTSANFSVKGAATISVDNLEPVSRSTPRRTSRSRVPLRSRSTISRSVAIRLHSTACL
jgi:hypothetical protein